MEMAHLDFWRLVFKRLFPSGALPYMEILLIFGTFRPGGVTSRDPLFRGKCRPCWILRSGIDVVIQSVAILAIFIKLDYF